MLSSPPGLGPCSILAPGDSLLWPAGWGGVYSGLQALAGLQYPDLGTRGLVHTPGEALLDESVKPLFAGLCSPAAGMEMACRGELGSVNRRQGCGEDQGRAGSGEKGAQREAPRAASSLQFSPLHPPLLVPNPHLLQPQPLGCLGSLAPELCVPLPHCRSGCSVAPAPVPPAGLHAGPTAAEPLPLGMPPVMPPPACPPWRAPPRAPSTLCVYHLHHPEVPVWSLRIWVSTRSLVPSLL